MDARWPLDLSIKNELLQDQDLTSIYYNYKNTCIQKLGKLVALKPHLLSEKLFKLATDKNILSCLNEFIGPDISIWSSAFFVKEAKSKKYVGYHQDNPYWQLSSSNVYTAWIALSFSKKENGCLEFIDIDTEKKYNLDIKNPYQEYKKGNKTTEENDLISYKQDIPINNIESSRKYVELNPGEFSIHNVNVVHGSGSNESNNPRIGFAIRYVDSKTYHLKDKKDSATHISGKKSEYFDLETHPKGEFSEFNIDEYNRRSSTAGTFGNKSY